MWMLRAVQGQDGSCLMETVSVLQGIKSPGDDGDGWTTKSVHLIPPHCPLKND